MVLKIRGGAFCNLPIKFSSCRELVSGAVRWFSLSLAPFLVCSIPDLFP